jgi:predicted Zn-dependent peptidase
MFTDPQVVTVNSVAQSMPRVESNGLKSIYRKADSTFQLTLSHIKSGANRIRSMARIDQRAIVSDPLTSANDYETLSFYVVIDRPDYGFTQTQVDQLIAGLKTWLDTTASGKLFGQET